MSGQDDHLSHHNVLRGQASLFTVMFLLGMLVRSSYCPVISNNLTSQKREMTQLRFHWPVIFPVLVGSVSSLECLDAPAVLGITMHRETQGWWLSVRFWLHEIIILLPLELGRPTVQEDGGDIIFKVCADIIADYFLNPLSPNIHIQILQTDLHTFSLRISWENLIRDQRFFSLWSFY